jgi:hypothetical protein
MNKKRTNEIVTAILQAQNYLMACEYDEVAIREALTEAMETWGDEEAAVKAVLGDITDRHAECARSLGLGMTSKALAYLFPANTLL